METIKSIQGDQENPLVRPGIRMQRDPINTTFLAWNNAPG